MAGRGPAPKERHTRKTNDRPVKKMAERVVRHGPALPEGVLPEGETWHAQTVALWDSLRRSPIMANEPALGWQFLLDTALMHHTMWSRGKWEFAAEVRLRLAKFGATPEDRMRLKVSITPTGQQSTSSAGKPGSVTDIRSRRSRLSGES